MKNVEENWIFIKIYENLDIQYTQLFFCARFVFYYWSEFGLFFIFSARSTNY